MLQQMTYNRALGKSKTYFLVLLTKDAHLPPQSLKTLYH